MDLGPGLGHGKGHHRFGQVDSDDLAGQALRGDQQPAGTAAPSALRYYERRGLLEPDGRRAGRRQYEPSVLDRLAIIELGRTAGFTLADTKLVLDSGLDRTVLHQIARDRIVELDARIAEAELAKTYLRHTLECPAPVPLDCPRLRAILASALPRRRSAE